MVGEELDVFVGEVQHFVVGSDGLGALVLVEAFLEIQLKKRIKHNIGELEVQVCIYRAR